MRQVDASNVEFTASILGSATPVFSSTFAASGISQIKFYAGDQETLLAEQPNYGLYFNNINVIPEPSTSLLMGLAVDGRHELAPKHRDDAALFAGFARHQCRFKGLGPALGGAAPAALAQLAARAGYRVELAASDWQLPSGKLLEATLDGIAAAACEADPSLDLADWRRVRKRQLAAGKLTLTVGHRDLFAVRHRRRPICRPG